MIDKNALRASLLPHYTYLLTRLPVYSPQNKKGCPYICCKAHKQITQKIWFLCVIKSCVSIISLSDPWYYKKD